MAAKAASHLYDSCGRYEPPADNEAPVDGIYVNELCRATIDEGRVTNERRVLRKPRQTAVDFLGRATIGYFESTTRLEVVRADLAPE